MRVIRFACYVRVSTASKSRQGDTTSFDQNPEVQEQPLRELIAQRGWELYRVYSGRAGGDKESRPGLDALMGDAVATSSMWSWFGDSIGSPEA